MNRIRVSFGHRLRQSVWSFGLVSLYMKRTRVPFYRSEIYKILFIELYLRWVIDQSHTRNMFHQIQALITKEKETRSKVNVFSPETVRRTQFE